jgi:hypothetical protein
MRPHQIPRIALGFCLYASTALANLPYNPNRALLSPDGSIIYLFTPGSAAGSDFQLLALNTTTSLSASSLNYTTLPALPFSDTGSDVSFTPAINDNGTISVYAGQCGSGVDGSSTWTFTPAANQESGNGTWTKRTTSAGDSKTALDGANYMASGISFVGSGVGNETTSSLYIFGGMCPTSTTTSTTTWQSDADYSNSMVALNPQAPTGANTQVNYILATVNSGSHPIAEAGFSLTGLQATISNVSGVIQSRQQNFIMIGGHTQTAFINMSQVALFSLPEQSWNYITVSLPTASGTGELKQLAARDIPEVDSRSGHSAVLTPDGSKIIVFGGWVGDINTPAVPQLLVMDIGTGFGGDSTWQWSIPSTTGTYLGTGEGLWGHGAVMLPGGVMMIMGGYSISASGGSKAKRQTATVNSKNYFFNSTSNAFITDYTNPQASSSVKDNHNGSHGSSALDTTGKKVGLGVGLVLGLLLIVAAVLLYFCIRRRSDENRVRREKELQELSLGAARFHHDGLGQGGIDGRGGEKDAMWTAGMQQREDSYPWAPTAPGIGNGDGQGWKEGGTTEAERTGLLVEIPSPTRGLRRSLQQRGAAGSLQGPGVIHPIDERAEYEQQEDAITPVVGHKRTDSSNSNDPFMDPSNRYSQISTEQVSPARSRDQEVAEWVADWAAADAILNRARSTPSPDKERTHSNLSEISSRSGISGYTALPSPTGPSRSVSQRSVGVFSATNPHASTNRTTPIPFTNDTALAPNNLNRSYSLSTLLQGPRPETSGSGSGTGSGGSGVSSYKTAASNTNNFEKLQTEGETLLPQPDVADVPGSPSKTKGKGKVASGSWLGSAVGSMRKLTLPFSGGASSDRSSSPETVDPRGMTPSPTRLEAHRSMTTSHSGLWRHRKGAADWVGEAGAGGSQVSYNQPYGEHETDDDWDVEAAVRDRVVQVMFTVPRERLRVVNAGDDGISVSDMGDNGEGGGTSASRQASVKGSVHEGHSDIVSRAGSSKSLKSDVSGVSSPSATSSRIRGEKVRERIEALERQ